jgi:hypothetical protein
MPLEYISTIELKFQTNMKIASYYLISGIRSYGCNYFNFPSSQTCSNLNQIFYTQVQSVIVYKLFHAVSSSIPVRGSPSLQLNGNFRAKFFLTRCESLFCSSRA